MSDMPRSEEGARPADGPGGDTGASSPPAAQSPQHPVAPNPGIPPYARPNTAPGVGAPPAFYGAPPAAPPPGYGGVPRQAYPGAPPTWGGAPYGVPPRPPASRVLAIIALVSAIIGAVLSAIPVGWLFAWMFVLTAAVLAIVSLVRQSPGKRMSIAALIVSAGAVVIGVLWIVGFFVIGVSLQQQQSGSTPLEPESTPALRAPDFGENGTVGGEPLAPDTVVTLEDETDGGRVWEMAVGPIEDITSTALGLDQSAPANGAYLAVPVQLKNIGDDTIDLSAEYGYLPYSWLISADDDFVATAYLYGLEAYPSAYRLDDVAPGETVTYYELYDAEADVATTDSLFTVGLDSGQDISWAVSAG